MGDVVAFVGPALFQLAFSVAFTVAAQLLIDRWPKGGHRAKRKDGGTVLNAV